MNKVKAISRNDDLNPNPRYFVTFIARDSVYETRLGDVRLSFPGHVYVVWIKVEDKPGETIQEFEAYGFYPAEFQEDFVKLDLGGYGGALMNEYRASAPGPDLEVSRLQVTVAKQMFDYSKQSIKHWEQKETEYKFFVNNCVSFAGEVARALGLDVPNDTYTTPRSFLDKFMEENN